MLRVSLNFFNASVKCYEAENVDLLLSVNYKWIGFNWFVERLAPPSPGIRNAQSSQPIRFLKGVASASRRLAFSLILSILVWSNLTVLSLCHVCPSVVCQQQVHGIYIVLVKI